MKTLNIFLILLFLSYSANAGKRCSTYAESLKIAKKTDTPILILVYGSSWNKPGEFFCKKVWQSNRLISMCPNITLWADDLPESTPVTHKKKKDDSTPTFAYKVWNVPALVYCDSQGRPIHVKEGLTADTSMEDTLAFIAKAKGKLSMRNYFWELASSASNEHKAGLLGQGLDWITFKIAKQYYKDIIKDIVDLDKNDISGYVAKYVSFDSSQIAEKEVWEVAKTGKYNELLKKFDVLLKNSVLTQWQRQEVHAMRYSLYKRWNGHHQEMLSELKAIIDIAPNSDMAAGAKNLVVIQKRDEEIKALDDRVIAIEKLGDKVAFTQIGSTLSKFLKPTDRSRDYSQIPSFDKPPGELISPDAYLTASSYDAEWDYPMLHPMLLRDEFRGFAHTKEEKSPWFKVELPEISSLAGIVIVNRNSCSERQIPIAVDISIDGKKWKRIFYSDNNKKVWSINLKNKKYKAKYIKIYRADEKIMCFHLSNILIYKK